eukprot:6182640-Pleurochrysis_carterae.AAC.3
MACGMVQSICAAEINNLGAQGGASLKGAQAANVSSSRGESGTSRTGKRCTLFNLLLAPFSQCTPSRLAGSGTRSPVLQRVHVHGPCKRRAPTNEARALRAGHLRPSWVVSASSSQTSARE